MTFLNPIRSHFISALALSLGLICSAASGIAAGAADTTAKPAAENRAEPQQFVLQNGMHVIVQPEAGAPVVTHFLTFKSGAADDPAGLSGVAHFVARLMATGTKENPGDSYDATITRDGGKAGFYTRHDYTVFWARVPAAKLHDVMQTEADRMTHLSFGGDKMDRLTDGILAERRHTIDNRPDALALEQARAALYLTHPYGTPVIGWPTDIRHISRSDVVNFYKRHYAPNNAILVVVGDVKADAVRTMAEEEYGSLPRQQLVPRTSYTMPPRLGPTRISVSPRSTRITEFLRIYRVKSYANAAPGEAEALEITAKVLGGSKSAYLTRTLVRERALASKISVTYHGYASDAGELIIRAKPRPGVTLTRLEHGIDAQLHAFQHRHIPEAQLKTARQVLNAEIQFRHDDPLAEATAYGRALAIGLTLQDVTDAKERIAKVTAATEQRVANHALRPENSVTVYLTPGR